MFPLSTLSYDILNARGGELNVNSTEGTESGYVIIAPMLRENLRPP